MISINLFLKNFLEEFCKVIHIVDENAGYQWYVVGRQNERKKKNIRKWVWYREQFGNLRSRYYTMLYGII